MIELKIYISSHGVYINRPKIIYRW